MSVCVYVYISQVCMSVCVSSMCVCVCISCVCVYVYLPCVYVCVSSMCLGVSMKTRGGHEIPWTDLCWKPISCIREEQQGLLTTEPALQPCMFSQSLNTGCSVGVVMVSTRRTHLFPLEVHIKSH